MIAVMGTRERRHNPRYQLSGRRIAALALLLVLVTGLSITNFTEGWIAALPYHDHLILSTRALGIVHHAHDGDQLDHAQRYLRTVETTEAHAVPGQPHDDGIVSLRPLTAQPELNSFTAQGWVAGDSLPLSPEAGLFAPLAALLLAVGRRFAPPSPPPRLA
jgi:hypothetical protein